MNKKVLPVPFVIINKGQELENKYLPANRTWQAISTIESTGSRLWASWMSGGATEPDPDNHLILAYSDDNGLTWVDPFMIIDSDSKDIRGRDPVLWQNNLGELMYYYGFGDRTYCINIKNPNDSIDSLIISEPKIIFEFGLVINKPAYYHDGYLLMYDPYDKKRKYSYNRCLYSLDGYSWKKLGKLKSKSKNKWFQEGTIIEKKDGTLFALTRIELANDGGLEATTSTNGGKSFKVMENNQPYPFYGPGSKCYFRRLKSGNMFFINNNSTSKTRNNMSAYISKDEGKTWSSLLIDYRAGCAYPDATEDNDGNIYIIFDSGRKTRNEIRISKFKEDDVFASKYISENCIRLLSISKNPTYRDIINASKISDDLVRLTLEDNEVIDVKGEVVSLYINGLSHTLFKLGDELENLKITDSLNLLLDL